MPYVYHDPITGANLALLVREREINLAYFQDPSRSVLNIAWNRGPDQTILVDGEAVLFPGETLVPLVMNQLVQFQRPEDLVLWQFDKPFYCVEENDSEVSCIGFLFWGQRRLQPLVPIDLSEMERILEFFVAEFKNPDRIQNEMLRALLKRLLVRMTLLIRQQALPEHFKNSDLDIVRQFNVLLEKNFWQFRQVQDYARLLHKSPKTLTNVFALYNGLSPLQVIHERISLEARRLLLHSHRPVREISDMLGFQEVSHFSRFFKNVVGESPDLWRRRVKTGSIGMTSGDMSIPRTPERLL